ncbi:MAG: SemiSWEET transporter [Flavobacteriaceae bacterium]|nr:SemiSWEET transporter [Flavobacteriaceae bacterium]
MEFNIEIIGLIAAFLTTSAFVPQAVKIWKTKEVKHVSLTMYFVMLAGIILWFCYGCLLGSISIIVANVVTGFIVISIIYLKIKYSEIGN